MSRKKDKPDTHPLDFVIEDCKTIPFDAVPAQIFTFTSAYRGGPQHLVGQRQTYDPGSPTLTTLEDANGYANSIIYRDLWTFSVEAAPSYIVRANVVTHDPIDRRAQVTITQTLPVQLPTTVAQIDHLVLELIRCIEEHERLEILARLRPGATVPERLFPPHTPQTANPFMTNNGFEHGEAIMRDHDAWMRDRAVQP